MRLLRRAVLSKLSQLALRYAAEGGGDLSLLRFYRDAIASGRVAPPQGSEPPEERWVLLLGYRRLDERWLDAELLRLAAREPRL